MNRTLLATLAGILISAATYGQKKLAYSEYGIAVGTLNYSGDIASTNSVSATISELRPDFGIFAMRHFNDWFAIGAEAHYGWFYADDQNHSEQNRGLQVTTTVSQINAFVEANLIRFGKFHYDRKFGLYVKAGGGFLAYNPTLTVNNLIPENIELYPNSYSGISYFGLVGIKFRTSFRSVLRFEVYRNGTTTDHMEGFEYTDQVTSNDTFGGFRIAYSVLIL